MLVELKVSNFAIINSVSLQFKEGLNILSGETGAGKSVLLKSLALLMGEKTHSDIVRTGAESATIEGAFDLSHRPDVLQKLHDLGIETPEDSLIVRRVLSTQGKSRVYLNDALTALNGLKEIICPLIEITGHYSAPLIEMTGQHDNRYLQSKSYHLDMLDRLADIWNLRQQCEQLYEKFKKLSKKKIQLQKDRMQREQRLDFLIYQRDEISNLNLQIGEEEELQARFKKAKNSSRLIEFASESESVLYGDDDSVLVRIHRIIQRGQELEDNRLSEKIEPLQTAKTLIEEVVYELREYSHKLESSPQELDLLENRMTQLRHLQRKYGESVESILTTLDQINEEIKSLKKSDDILEKLSKQEKKLSQTLKALAEDLHNKRAQFCAVLTKKVNDELQDLNMKGVIFGIDITTVDEVGSTGLSNVEFTIRNGNKDRFRPLAKFASGGELSRILLALKNASGLSDLPRTYLFDEVDSGVSGMTAEKVGRKLSSISQGQQVICITHLPQVASFADHHFLIQKIPSATDVKMEVIPLRKKYDRVNEIARLLSGKKISKTSRDHARQLLTESRKQLLIN